MPPTTVVPIIWRATPPVPCGPQRDATQDECERGHQDWSKTEPGSLQRSIYQVLAFFVFVFGELNDQDGVLGGETDQHHQANLRIHVVLNLNRA